MPDEFTPEQMMDSLYWWGVPTFFGCEHHKRLDEIDIALLGVPHSSGSGTTERDQHLGPRATREVSRQLRRVHAAFNIDPWKACHIADVVAAAVMFEILSLIAENKASNNPT